MANRSVRYSWEWPVTIGLVLVILGILAIIIPFAATVGVSLLMGFILLVSGTAQLIHAIRYVRDHGRVSRFLLSAIAIVAGVVTIRNPIAGAMGITLALAFYLLMGSLARGTLAFELGRFQGKGWMIFSTAISFLLGVYLLATFPVSSVIIPGVFLGVDLVFYGTSLISASNYFRRIEFLDESEVDSNQSNKIA